MHTELNDNITKQQFTSGEVERAVACFEPISLGDMDRVALLKRTDSKFILHISDLCEVLSLVEPFYQVLEIDSNRMMTYDSLYFDTPEYLFYNEHHNGKVKRVKIRMREYVESKRCYLEIKEKDHQGNTHKTRTKIPEIEKELSSQSMTFINKVLKREYNLVPSLRTGFKRFTLVNKCDQERVTIDLQLNYSAGSNSIVAETEPYKGLVIVEVKQERFDRESPIVKALRTKRIHKYSLSKYCIGMIVHYKNLKYNSFKEKLLKIKKVGVA
ncbi:MAG: polyphosphate polymerase domain-containing protein [Fibrobacterales bacterium]